jgi:hypothetical protein
MLRRKLHKDESTNGKRAATVEKASTVARDDSVIKALDFSSPKHEEKAAQWSSKPSPSKKLLAVALQRVREAASELKVAEATQLAASLEFVRQLGVYEARKRQLPAHLRDGPCMGRWFVAEVEQMHAYYSAEQFLHDSDVAWLRVRKAYSEAEEAHAEAVHALDQAKIMMLRRKLRVARMLRRKRKRGRFV